MLAMKYVLEKLNILPKHTLFVLASALLNIIIFTIFRIIFWFVFNVPDDTIPVSILTKSLYLGLKFDIRLALLIHLPVLLLAWVKPLSVIHSPFGRYVWIGYLISVNLIILIFYVFDFGHYEYLQSRLDAAVLRFLYNKQESFGMILESYPVFWGLLSIALYTVAYGFAIIRLTVNIKKAHIIQITKLKRIAVLSLIIFIYLFGIYGKFSWYPLRWSDAFFSTHVFASDVSLNPVLYFFDTYKNKDTSYDVAKVKKYYDVIADYLGVANKESGSLRFNRYMDEPVNRLTRPNVIMVFLESFAYYKTGLSGNPLNPTPNFDALAKESILFTRFYTPHGGTARSVFCAITGIPDIELNKTSSRNPLVVRQHTIVESFKGYGKYYFLGGSANWGEIRGLLSHNIPNLQVYEEGSYSSPKIDVWGISDLHLFEEANKVLRTTQDQPFFAIIHTSGNHKPYTIPDDNRGFQPVQVPEESMVKYGFRSVAAYNAFRFMDHGLGIFIKTVKKEKYFNNTIFVFFGDHGTIRNASHMFKAENQLLLNRYHVPLLIYAPGLIKGGKQFNKVASEVDVLPTIAGLASIPHINSAFGRDLLDSRYDGQRYAFTILHRLGPEIGLIGEKFYFLTDVAGKNKRLHQIYAETPRINVIDKFPEVALKMEILCRGIYETAKYIRIHNTPEAVFAGKDNNR